MKASETTSKASICWNCKNGRADRCGWIDKKEKVWGRAIRKRCGKKWKPFDVWIVQECKCYKEEAT